jgi:hypothetical protein
MTTATLAELADALQQVQALAETAETDEQRADLEAMLATLSDDLVRKGEGIGYIVRRLEQCAEVCEFEANQLKAELERLKNRAKAAQAKADWLKEYAKRELQNLGLDRLETPTCTLSIVNNPPRCEVLNEKEVPGQFLVVKTTYSVDKVAIKRWAEQTGEVVPGVEIVRDSRLEVR